MTDTGDRTTTYGDRTEAEAVEAIKQDGLRPRICRRDDQLFVVTRDFRKDRVNLEIENNRVVHAWMG